MVLVVRTAPQTQVQHARLAAAGKRLHVVELQEASALTTTPVLGYECALPPITLVNEPRYRSRDVPRTTQSDCFRTARVLGLNLDAALAWREFGRGFVTFFAALLVRFATVRRDTRSPWSRSWSSASTLWHAQRRGFRLNGLTG